MSCGQYNAKANAPCGTQTAGIPNRAHPDVESNNLARKPSDKALSTLGCGYTISTQYALSAGEGTGYVMYPHDCCNALSSSQIANLHACIDPCT